MQDDSFEESLPAGERITFRSVVTLSGKTATGIQVPGEVVAAFGSKKRPAVRITVGRHTYRTTVAAYGDEYWVPLSAENREAAGVAAGDAVDVTIELDREPREVTLPPDFAGALDQDPGARQFFEGLSYSNQRRIVLAIEGAKTAETRQRRINKAVESLRLGRI